MSNIRFIQVLMYPEMPFCDDLQIYRISKFFSKQLIVYEIMSILDEQNIFVDKKTLLKDG
jgi:hypothetical protein